MEPLKITLNGSEITDWRKWARPKQKVHWKGGRSAMELARAWFTAPSPVCPHEIADLLATHPVTANLTLEEAHPEYVTPLPERGEGRNHDLLILARDHQDTAVIAIEAKADEPFDKTIGGYWRKMTQSPRPTKAPQRIEALLQVVFGGKARPDTAPWEDLRYQLLTGTAGVAIEADQRKSTTAVFIVHEFRTEKTNDNKMKVNAEDYKAFVRALIGSTHDVETGLLYGPIRLESGPHLENAVNLFVGKARYDWDGQ